MPKIQVDDKVIAALGERGEFGDSFNDVIRKVLGLPRLEFRMADPPLADQGLLAEILTAGYLQPGQIVAWHRPRLKKTYYAAVTPGGRLMTNDGHSYVSPDACASAVAGYPCKGWGTWKTEAGTSLQELRGRVTTETANRHAYQALRED
ncbi:hypothetical protein [Plantactinospora sp. CA-290183]|uniref:restriction system modified-DNA reader domain-containing protein n=1 Tax=Plantactinospora sp. CA-290183 TaxID=3240006 RepID=UPI003D90A31B